ncbi:MAG: hypothetical protein ACRD3M_15415, partial [Thermoanaerobaculia bacterium]
MIRLTLKPGREESVLRRHPWLFSGAVAAREGDGSDGMAEVLSAAGEPLARGAYSPGSQILARLWIFDGRPVDAILFRERFEAARKLREAVVPSDTTGYRGVNSEGDFCPGVLLDVYGDTAVLELLTEGTERWRRELEEAARNVFGPGRLLVRERGAQRDRGERHALTPALSRGEREQSALTPALSWGEREKRPRTDPLPEGEGVLASFTENGLRFFADISAGQTTGFYLDQRE